MKKKFSFTAILVICGVLSVTTFFGQSQGVAINTNGAPPDLTASLDITSTTKGLLIPRMTSVQRDAISSPATGLQIYNLDCGGVDYWNGTCWLSMLAQLQHPGAITTASTIFCSGASQTYSISSVPGASNYVWTVPPGASITSGQGTTAIEVLFSTVSGDVCVTAFNNCSSSPESCIDVYVTPAPSAITATTPGSICGAGSVTVGAAAGSGTINWYAASTGGEPLGTGPTYTTSISATTTFYAEVSSIGCTPPARTPVVATLFQSSPQQPDAISGPSENVGGLTSVTYSITELPSYSHYSWSVPSGASITAGQGTSSITVDFGCSSSGPVAVTPSNECGTGSGLGLNVSTNLVVPGSISGPTALNTNSSGTYSVSAVPNVVSYTWTVVNGNITSGQGTNSIDVNWPNSGTGSVSVIQSSLCGSSGAQTLSVGVNTQEYSYTGSIQQLTVGEGISSITIEAWGGAGADHFGISTGGKGAYIKGTFAVSEGETLNIVVGQAGIPGCGNEANCGGGGGGGSFVFSDSDLLVAAGGGGGGSLQNDGAPLINGYDGQASTSATDSRSGATGGTSGADGAGDIHGNGWNTVQSNPAGNGTYGGYGGGGDANNHGGGGGGGYSGGGGQTYGGNGCNYGDGGGGGGSYNAGTDQTNTSGVQSGNGHVIITW